jgi:hypothetical protein
VLTISSTQPERVYTLPFAPRAKKPYASRLEVFCSLFCRVSI